MVFDLRKQWPLRRGHETAGTSSGSAPVSRAAQRPRSLSMAIEQRMLFDGAAVATAADVCEPANHDPVAAADARTTGPVEAIHGGNVLCGTPAGDQADVDPDGDPLVVTGVAAGKPAGTPYGGTGEPVQGSYGTLLLHADGSYDYVPNEAAGRLVRGQTAQDVFTYTICDNKGGEDTGTLTITVSGNEGNRPPTASDDHRGVREDQAILDGQVLRGNAFGDVADSDPDGDALVVAGVAHGVPAQPDGSGIGRSVQGQYGTLTLQADGSYTYVPDAAAVRSLVDGEYRHDRFYYVICDVSGATSRADLTLTVWGQNFSPIGHDDARSIAGDEAITDGQAIAGNSRGDVADSDPDGDAFDVTGAAAGVVNTWLPSGVGDKIQGNWGTLTIQSDGRYTYVPSDAARALASGEQRSDVFTYQLCDNKGGEGRATITVTIRGVDTPPAPPPPPGEPPTSEPHPPAPPPPAPPPVAEQPPAAPPPAAPPVVEVQPPPKDAAGPVLPPVGGGLHGPTATRDASAPLAFAPVAASEFGPRPEVYDRMVLPADPFGAGAPMQVAGFVEEAPDMPAERVAAKPEIAPLARKGAGDADDCVPTPRAKVKPPVARPKVFSEVLAPKSASFSEQVQVAKKRFKPPVRLAPAGRQC